METARMIKWPPVMVSPSSRVPERAPDWFFVVIEACDGRTPDLGFFLGVPGFIGIFGVGFTSGVQEAAAR